MSNSYVLTYQGKVMRPIERDFTITSYTLTAIQKLPGRTASFEYSPINAKKPLFEIA